MSSKLRPYQCKEITSEEIKNIQDIIQNDPNRAYFKLRNMIKNDKFDFSTGESGAVFWGTSMHRKTNNMKIAQGWAQANGKTILEQTSGGKVLEKLDLFTEEFGFAKAAKLWNMASTNFALGASGNINVFNTGANRFGEWGERTWWRIEKPVLLRNDAVDSVTRRRRRQDGMPAKTGHIKK